MALKSVWGIDVGKYSIKAVRLDRKKTEFLVGATDIIPYRTLPLFEKDVEWEDLVYESLRDLYFRQRIGEAPVVVTLTGHQIFNRIIEISTPDARRLPELVKHEAKQQIPGNIDEVIWQYQDITPPGSVDRQVALFAMRKDVVERFMDTLRLAGVMPIGLTVAPLAVCNYILYDQKPDEPLVLLDMGSDSTGLLVLEGKRVWIRPLRTVGNDFTRAIREAAGGQLAEAEKIKRQIGRHPKKDRLLKSLEPLQNEMVTEIQRSLGFYKQQADEAIDFRRLLVMGGGTRVPGLTRALGRGLQMQVEGLTELGALRLGPKADANLFNSNLPVLAPALGLALQGHGVSDYKVNLMPPDSIRGLEMETKKGWVVAAGILVLLAGIILFGFFNYTSTKMDALLASVQQERKELQRRQGDLEAARDHARALATRNYNLEAVKHRLDSLEILHRLHALLPEENDIDAPPGEEGSAIARESRSIRERRRLFSTLSLDTQVLPSQVVEEADPDTGETRRYRVTMKKLVTQVTAWYYRTANRSGPATDFLAAVQAAFPEDQVEMTSNPATFELPDPGSPESSKGEYVKFEITITRDLGEVGDRREE